MPPKRCPECGRFLSNELVASLASSSVPCPRCDTPLSADTIVGGGGGARQGARAQPVVAALAVTSTAGNGRAPQEQVRDPASVSPPQEQVREPASVRPPDLDPRQVRSVEDNVLAGWDAGVTADEIAGWRSDRRPFPTDTVIVAVGALLGGVIGGAVCDRRRALGAGIGVVGGAVAAGAGRRVWELRP